MKGKHIFVEHPREHLARRQVRTGMYFEIAQSEYCDCLSVEKLDTSGFDEFELSAHSDRVTRHAVKAIVFSAMCVEAAINDYAGAHLGDKYFETHLSSLDVVSKWVVIPKLVCGNTLDKSSAAYSALKQLIRSRNQLVHSKSRELDIASSKLFEQIEVSNSRLEADFKNSLKAVYLLAMEMDYVVGQKFNPIGTMDTNFFWVEEPPEALKPLFDECKKIILKKYS